MEMFFSLRGWKVYTSSTGHDGLGLADEIKPVLVILDIRLPDINGLEVLKALRERHNETQVIMITAYQDMESTIQAIKLGAYDYLHKPIDINELDLIIHRLEEAVITKTWSSEDSDNQFFEQNYKSPYIVGRSREMKEVFKTIALLSESLVTALIQGESGTGKELIARAIHYNSSLKNESFSVIDCSTLVDNLIESELFGHEKGAFTGATETRKGRLELTGDGTIFFDEISELPLSLQSKLLRFIQEREFVRVGGSSCIHSNARIIAATNRNLLSLVQKKIFREDLYFRLKVVNIDVPPLRDRRSDIPVLSTFFLKKISSKASVPIKNLTQDAIDEMMNYDWPGNVRELENTLTRAVVLSKSNTLTKHDVISSQQRFENQEEIPKMESLTLEAAERKHIRNVLKMCGWHLGKTCEILEISRPTLRSKMKKYNISKDSVQNINKQLFV
jgi:two-component system response regulator AtoC